MKEKERKKEIKERRGKRRGKVRRKKRVTQRARISLYSPLSITSRQNCMHHISHRKSQACCACSANYLLKILNVMVLVMVVVIPVAATSHVYMVLSSSSPTLSIVRLSCCCPTLAKSSYPFSSSHRIVCTAKSLEHVRVADEEGV